MIMPAVLLAKARSDLDKPGVSGKSDLTPLNFKPSDSNNCNAYNDKADYERLELVFSDDERNCDKKVYMDQDNVNKFYNGNVPNDHHVNGSRFNEHDISGDTPSISSLHNDPCKAIRCGGCGNLIEERFYLQTVGRNWHCYCLRCAHCSVQLESESSCFLRNGQIYCKDDYYKLFCPKCSGCCSYIKPEELVMKIKRQDQETLFYHVYCFICCTCNQKLHKGDYFGLYENSVYCRYHHKILTEKIYYEMLIKSDCVEDGKEIKKVRKKRVVKKKKNDQNNENELDIQSYTEDQVTARSCFPPSATNSATITIQTTSTSISTASTLTPTIVTDSTKNFTSFLSNLTETSAQDFVQDFSGHNGNNNSNSSSCFSVSSPSEASGLMSSMGSKPKRMRTSFKHNQLRAMRTHFNINHNPDSKDLKSLSLKTGLSKRVLQVWFQNARAKWRRNLLRQQSLGPQIVQESRPLEELSHKRHTIGSNSAEVNSLSQSNNSSSFSSSPASGASLSSCSEDGLFIDSEPISPLIIRQEEQNIPIFTQLY